MALPVLDIQLTREYFMRERQALLMQLDALERMLSISPRTAELRKDAKAERQVVESEEKKEGENGLRR